MGVVRTRTVFLKCVVVRTRTAPAQLKRTTFTLIFGQKFSKQIFLIFFFNFWTKIRVKVNQFYCVETVWVWSFLTFECGVWSALWCVDRTPPHSVGVLEAYDTL